MMRIRRGFTLIELLTVMAMSAILLGLIIIPLIQSFNLTRQAQAFSEAQDRARILSERIAKEIGNAYSVRFAALSDTTLNGQAAKVPSGSTVVTVPANPGGLVEVALPYTRIDLVRPAEGDQSQVATGQFTNLDGRIDPTLQSPKGQVVLPVAPGFAMIRYFIGRRDPLKEYNNPYDGILMARNADRDNLYVLYRIEVQPLVLRGGVGSNGDTTVRWRPNLLYFQSDPVTDTVIQDIDDPKFFEPTRNAGVIVTNDAKADRIKKWLSRAVIQTEISRYDMLEPVYDLRTRAWVRLPGTQIPKIVPLIQFRPERISNDPATGHVAVRESEESGASDAAGPDVFTTQYAQWASFVVRVFPRGWDSNPSRNEYEVGLASDHAGEAGYAPGFSIYCYDPEANPDDFDINYLKNNEVFDVTTYTQQAAIKGQAAGDRIYPFSAAVASANSRSGFLASGNWNSIFTPFTVDPARGKVIASIGIEEVGNPSSAPTQVNNLPYKATSATEALSPANDTRTDGLASFNDAQYRPINDRFNLIYKNLPALLPDKVQRYIDIRSLPNSDGTPSPLFPNKIANQATGFTVNTQDGSYRNRVQIVPGSEVIVGPDQLPGPHYGLPIRYSRIATGEPGPNQYKINYADIQEPTDNANQVTAAAYQDRFGLPAGLVTGFDPRVYDPTNFVSAVLQPRYKVGYIQLNSDPNVPLPFVTTPTDSAQSGFRISYRFQFTGTLTAKPINGGRTKVDSFAVDYDSRELISVLLTIRNYPQTSQPNPQNVTLKATAKVRNYSR